MWSFLATPGFQPFTIAALVMLGLLAIEILSTLVGVSTSTLLDTVFGMHGVHLETDLHTHGPDGPFATAFSIKIE